MAYRLCIPVQLSQDDEIQREGILRQLRSAKTDTVFLIFDRYLTDEKALEEGIEKFKRNKAFYEENGFKNTGKLNEKGTDWFMVKK